MKQAIQEKFILDVLRSYTPVESYYKLVKTVEATPSSTPGERKRSCAGMSRATITPSA
jgi:type I restriction enzyme R subunit